MFTVGLTGGMGSGKSTVADLLARRGAVVIDADQLAREVVEPGRPAFDAVVERFGDRVVGPDGALDRPALAARVFEDDAARADLEAITHPAIGEALLERVAAVPPDAVIVMDVPLLVEKGHRSYDLVLVVEAPLAERLDRLETRGVARSDAEARMATQATDEERRAVADILIDNSGGTAELDAEVDRAWAAILRRRSEEQST
ncbi:MAG: dephospho-CoA kinase [Acidimicrobiia bacterium]|nr:dephospho-CoA kinase [Acidimicrobiia bacterium]